MAAANKIVLPPANPPIMAYDGVPVQANDCAIFIPSKGRFAAKNTTMKLLASAGVHFTVVVEPQEAAAYRTGLEDIRQYATVEVLPASNQGVSFARNYILSHLAPRGQTLFKKQQALMQQTAANYNNQPVVMTAAAAASSPTAAASAAANSPKTYTSRWFWIMDDDIKTFHKTITPGTTETCPPDALLREVYTRLRVIIAKENDPTGSNALAGHKIGLIGLEYQQFAFRSEPKHIVGNSYINIAVMMNLDRLPVGIRYRFRVREDFDFALQAIRHGCVNIRLHDLSFVVPSMNTQPGGMTDYYKLQKNRDIRGQNRLFLQTWGNELCEEVEKGAEGNERWDMKVKWQKLSQVATAQAFLLGVPGVPPRDPLAEPLPAPDPEALQAVLKRAAGTKHSRKDTSDSSSNDDDQEDDEEEEENEDEDDEEDDEEDNSSSDDDGYEAARGRPRRGGDSSSSDDEDEEDDDDVVEVAAPRKKKPAPKPKMKKNQTSSAAAAKPKPKPKSKPGWGDKWTTMVFRQVTDEVLAAGKLRRVENPELGMEVAWIPSELNKPPLLVGVVTNVYYKNVVNPETGRREKVVQSLRFSPYGKGEPTVSTFEVYAKPSNVSETTRLLKAYYENCDEVPDWQDDE